jgi:hypothetical protein
MGKLAERRATMQPSEQARRSIENVLPHRAAAGLLERAREEGLPTWATTGPERVEGQRACDCWGGRCWFYPELPWGVPPHWKASQSPYSKVDPAPTLDPARLHQPADAE